MKTLSKYTTELRFICETYAGLRESEGYSNIEKIIQKAIPSIFDFNFPIFNEDYRNVLCTKILKHYYTREIGSETVGLWKLRLNERMNLIMPYYNKLYLAWEKDFDPLHNTDITTTHILDRTENGEGQETGNNVQNGTARNLYSDTPQGSLQNVENESYLTNASKDISNNETNTKSNYTNKNTTTDNYIENIKGKSSGESFSDMLMKYRDALINIDLMVIDELNDLFMLIW